MGDTSTCELAARSGNSPKCNGLENLFRYQILHRGPNSRARLESLRKARTLVPLVKRERRRFFMVLDRASDTYSGCWRGAKQTAILVTNRNDLHRGIQGQPARSFNQPAEQAHAIVEVNDPYREGG